MHLDIILMLTLFWATLCNMQHRAINVKELCKIAIHAYFFLLICVSLYIPVDMPGRFCIDNVSIRRVIVDRHCYQCFMTRKMHDIVTIDSLSFIYLVSSSSF